MSGHIERKKQAHTVTTIRTVVFVRAALGVALLLVLLLPLSASAQATAPEQGKAGRATYVGEKACATCEKG